MTCAAISTDTDINEDKVGRSYWFPDTSTSDLNAIAAGTKDLWADETSHLIDSYYGGLDRWQVLNVSQTQFQAAKFQLNEKEITDDDTDATIYAYWSSAQDYNF